VLTAARDGLRHDGERYVLGLREAGVPVSHHITPNVDHYSSPRTRSSPA
jgi:acetyl esterase/lipase